MPSPNRTACWPSSMSDGGWNGTIEISRDGAGTDLVTGPVFEYDPPRRLSHGWTAHYDPTTAAEPESRVTWEIEPQDGGVTKLTVVHDRLEASPNTAANVAGGWSYVLSGLKTLLVSGGFTFFTERLKARLGLDYTRANTLEIVDGKLTGRVTGEIVNADVKARTLVETCAQLGIEPRRAIAMGDGSNDLKMMAEAGLSVAFRAKPVVREAASVAFNFVGLDGLLRLF